MELPRRLNSRSQTIWMVGLYWGWCCVECLRECTLEHTHTHTYSLSCLHMHIHLHTNIRICTAVHTFVCTTVHTQWNLHTHTHTHTARARSGTISRNLALHYITGLAIQVKLDSHFCTIARCYLGVGCSIGLFMPKQTGELGKSEQKSEKCGG